MKKVMFGLLGLIIFLASFGRFYLSITDNQIGFQSDEIYWIGTGKILPLLIGGRLDDPFWNEHPGFANLNGVKFTYGIGLMMMGHDLSDLKKTGLPPQTYFNWKLFEKYDNYPKDHEFFPVLRSGRFISGFFTALSVCLFFFLAQFIYPNVITSATAAALYQFHPLIQHAGTHALSDGIFMFWQMAVLLLTMAYIKTNYRKTFLAGAIGTTLAILISSKINGIMFFPVIGFMIGYEYIFGSKKIRRKNLLKNMIFHPDLKRFFLGLVLTFLVLHPNLFFYRDLSLIQIFKNRIKITSHHVDYYLTLDPEHVTLTILDRLRSFERHILHSWLKILFGVGLFLQTFILLYRPDHILHQNTKFFLAGTIVFFVVITYTVFDEGRYYLPVLPFVILTAVNWLNIKRGC